MEEPIVYSSMVFFFGFYNSVFIIYLQQSVLFAWAVELEMKKNINER